MDPDEVPVCITVLANFTGVILPQEPNLETPSPTHPESCFIGHSRFCQRKGLKSWARDQQESLLWGWVGKLGDLEGVSACVLMLML